VVTFLIDADTLGNTTFAFSPLAEVASSIRLLGEPHSNHIHQPWVVRARAALADLDITLLSQILPTGRWAPSFMYTPARSPETTFEDQLARLERTDLEVVRENLHEVWSDRPMPARLRALLSSGNGAVPELSELLWEYWERAIAPHWSRVCSVLEDDVAARASQAVAGGLYALLSDLHPEVSLADGRLMVNKLRHVNQTHTGRALTLIPSVFTYPGLVLDHDDRDNVALTYAARGVGRTWDGLREQEQEQDPDHLVALLGRSRARILTRLSVPLSTTDLAAELGQSPGTVSQHLTTLKGAGLLLSWRTGRRVLYRQTQLAESVIAASDVAATHRLTG
jgi:DNA-binding transcriptional ArsR family regulator